MQHGRKSPEAERYPHRKRGSSVLHQRRIPIPCDPTLQIGLQFPAFSEMLQAPVTDLRMLDQGGRVLSMSQGNSSSRVGARQPSSSDDPSRRDGDCSVPLVSVTGGAANRVSTGHSCYWGASNLWRPESGPLSAKVTVKGDRKVKFSMVSEGSWICWPLPAACTPPPMPPPAAAPIPAPFPPPRMPPRMAPIAAPPPTFSAVLVERFLPWRR